MFEEENQLENVAVTVEPAAKKKKVNHVTKSDIIHSSLAYKSIKAPPLIEYKSIDSYCENKLIEHSNNQVDLQDNGLCSSLKISDIQSISSPIVFKTPVNKGKMCNHKSKPYSFYSVEELSLIKSLQNWNNNKVCPVGNVFMDSTNCTFFLQSVNEVGKWQVLLDHSLLPEVPPIDNLLQIFGTIEVTDALPRIKIAFFRPLKSADLTLLVESYKLMERFVPSFVFKSDISEEVNLSLKEQHESFRCETPIMNDTLDGYNFSALDNL